MTVILHVGLLAGKPVLWAASNEAARRSAAGRSLPGRRAALAPYGLDTTRMRTALAAIPADGFAALPVTSAIAWLPTRNDAVIATGPGEIRPWRIEIAALSGPHALAFFSACLGREVIGDDIHLGGAVAPFAQALQFAFEFVARQSVLPGMIVDDTGARACWQPILGPGERAHYDALAAKLPRVIGALTTTSATVAPAYDTRKSFAEMLRFFVDSVMRAPQTATRAADARPKSLHARWLAALDGPEASFGATQSECTQLASAIEAWQRPVVEERAAAYRLCLRVEEPPEIAPGDEQTERWNVAYLLQSRTDPTLLVDAVQAMRSKRMRREYLTALGRAASVLPTIDASLVGKGSAPAGLALDTAGAFTFLQTDAPQCAAADIGLILPSWWLGMDAKARVGLRATVKRPTVASGNAMHAGALLEVDWTIALGDEALTARELERLARLKTPLVRLRGRWIHVDPAELRCALAHVQRTGRRALSVGDAVRIAVGATVDGVPEGTRLHADGDFAELLARLRSDTRLEPLAPPAALHATLRPYQARGYAWLHFLTRAGFGGCLADDMGLGKTVQTLALFARDWEADGQRPVLLVCPTSVIGNWQREAQRFTPALPVHVHHGGDRSRGTAFETIARSHALIITGYALLHRDRALFASVAWRGMVLDEAQNIKNANSQQAQAARSIGAGYRVALTGTPVENHVGDLWSIMEFLNPGMLGSSARFRRDFAIPIQVQADVAAAQRLRAITGPFMLRRLKSDATIISDLPAKQEYTVICTLTREQATLYAAVLRDFDATLAQPDGIEKRGKILGTLSKLKQICNHPAQFAGDNSPLAGRSGKLARLEEMLEEILAAGEAALVFTQFAEMGDLIRRRLQQRFGRDISFLHGGVTQRARDEMVERFARRTGPEVFILSLKAGGSGLNLTRANHVFHFDRWWNPAVENQATDRAFRIGQKLAVQVHKYVCAGTLEEKIAGLIERKAAVSERVVGTGEGWLTELTSAQLRDLVALAPEAVAE